MWLFLPAGFFSIVQKPGDDHLTIRARVRTDLDRLREGLLPKLGPTQETRHADYPYRATASHEAVGRALSQAAQDTTYANFKSEVSRQQGAPRARLYGEVWSVLYGCERRL